MTTIKKCTCKSSFQDKVYGAMMRVFNYTKDKKGVRCSVCGREERVI